MEAKHTPGPWIFSGNTSSSATVTAPRKYVDPGSRYGAPEAPEAVAICRGNSEIRKANARLIAAAPDLLLALKRLLSELPAKRDWLDPDTEQIGKDAIAKAEGRNQ